MQKIEVYIRNLKTKFGQLIKCPVRLLSWLSVLIHASSTVSISDIQGKRPYVCLFDTPTSDKFHCKPEVLQINNFMSFIIYEFILKLLYD